MLVTPVGFKIPSINIVSYSTDKVDSWILRVLSASQLLEYEGYLFSVVVLFEFEFDIELSAFSALLELLFELFTFTALKFEFLNLVLLDLFVRLRLILGESPSSSSQPIW